jgi:hypothetical protein
VLDGADEERRGVAFVGQRGRRPARAPVRHARTRASSDRIADGDRLDEPRSRLIANAPTAARGRRRSLAGPARHRFGVDSATLSPSAWRSGEATPPRFERAALRWLARYAVERAASVADMRAAADAFAVWVRRSEDALLRAAAARRGPPKPPDRVLANSRGQNDANPARDEMVVHQESSADGYTDLARITAGEVAP